jgi:hypothetical protein
VKTKFKTKKRTEKPWFDFLELKYLLQIARGFIYISSFNLKTRVYSEDEIYIYIHIKENIENENVCLSCRFRVKIINIYRVIKKFVRVFQNKKKI